MATYQFAGFWRRFVAYMIDGFIIGVVFIILAIVAGTAYFAGAMSGDNQVWIAQLTDPERFGSFGILITAFYLLLYMIYFTYFHGLNGRTPGKNLLGLQVVSADGSPISFGIAFLRSAGYLVSSLLFTVPLGFIWIAFDKKKQGWHDKIAGTVVIIREQQENAAGISIPDDALRSDAMTPGNVSGSIPPVQAEKPDTPSGGDTTGADGQKIP
ncbi:MAG: hypothetical protein CVU71_09210 [Deltaproteobacteria bacterium HGW-Deltaproteobacteria-6]|jgi:uncharacterized RDD family membrane protein YckC|nr:MAG: hypothetical protein CVU71_09210 [Deltaproteobacteria bacterium HGW-Deltaproteobacteria-6]